MKGISKKRVIQALLIAFVIVVTIYASLGIYGFSIVSSYDAKVYPNVYIDNYDVSNLTNEKLKDYIENISNEVNSSKVVFQVNNKEYEYELEKVGITLNKEQLKKEMLQYKDDLDYLEKLKKIVLKEKKVFSFELQYNENDIIVFLEELKNKVDTKKTQGKLVMGKDRNLAYQKGVASFNLDISKSLSIIKDKLDTILSNNKMTLEGSSTNPDYDILSTINTKISTYSTKFDNKVSRGQNISNAAKSLDGVILQPGAIFSFYKYAGSYTKKGYVYYLGVLGNGVCQVASTMYNVELLAGLETIERYSHAEQMVYVKGGLDATVSERAGKSRLDFKFKNTLDYPIYISAYTNGGTLTIEFWSNDKALNGKTYKTESQKIGYKGYKTYLLTYKDGKQISKKYIATTWYPK